MSTRPWQKIDKFFPVYIAALILLAGLIIITGRGIFSSVVAGFEADEQTGTELSIDHKKLEDALNAVFERENIPLEVADERIPREDTE